jgi:hypothetical protein
MSLRGRFERYRVKQITGREKKRKDRAQKVEFEISRERQRLAELKREKELNRLRAKKRQMEPMGFFGRVQSAAGQVQRGAREFERYGLFGKPIPKAKPKKRKKKRKKVSRREVYYYA